MAISCLGLTDFYRTIYQSHSSQINNVRYLINHIQWLEAQLHTVTTARDDMLAQADTRCGRFDTLLQITTGLSADGNGCGEGSFENPTIRSISLHCLLGTSSWRLLISSFTRWISGYIKRERQWVPPSWTSASIQPRKWWILISISNGSGLPRLVRVRVESAQLTNWQSGLWIYLVLAMVPDRHFGSGSGSKPNRCQIGGPGRQ